MPTLAEGRQAVADAVTAATSLTCFAYPPDSPQPPGAFVDVVRVTYETGAWFCSGAGSFTVVTFAERNDIPSALATLENYIPEVVKALQNLSLLIQAVDSGILTVGGQDLPAVTYRVQGRV